MQIIKFSDVPGAIWDKWVSAIPESTYLHSSRFLNYLHAMRPPEEAQTFACVESEEKPLALCPFGLFKRSLAGQEFLEASWGGGPMAAPAFADLPPSASQKLQKQLFAHWHDQFRQLGVKRCSLRRYPITQHVLAGRDSAIDQLSLLMHGYECQPQNTSIVDFRYSAEELEARLSKYQRKHIKKSIRQGLRVVAYAGPSPETATAFAAYQAAHVKAAGRLTRPQKSFDLMLQFLQENAAHLFVAYAKDIPISFLFCGEFNTAAYGWSQANLDEYEKEYSPRHLLEWEAILHYKQAGFRYYEIGTIWHGPQPYLVPNAKELSIAEFKRRYGGCWFPELCFEKIFDKELWQLIHQQRVEAFLQSGYFDLPAPTAGAESDEGGA